MKGAEYEYERLANSVFVLRIVLCMRTVTCNALTPGRHFTYIPLRNFFLFVSNCSQDMQSMSVLTVVWYGSHLGTCQGDRSFMGAVCYLPTIANY